MMNLFNKKVNNNIVTDEQVEYYRKNPNELDFSNYNRK